MLYGVSNSSNTTGSTYNLVFMQRSISLYRALKNTRFSSTSPTRIFGDFWYVIEDMFLDQKPLKNLLLQLVAGWPTFCDKMPGLFGLNGLCLTKGYDFRVLCLNWNTISVHFFPVSAFGTGDGLNVGGPWSGFIVLTINCYCFKIQF